MGKEFVVRTDGRPEESIFSQSYLQRLLDLISLINMPLKKDNAVFRDLQLSGESKRPRFFKIIISY